MTDGADSPPANPGPAAPTPVVGEPKVTILSDITPAVVGAASGGPPGGGGAGTGTAVSVGPNQDLNDTRRTIAYILLAILAAVILIEALGSAIFATDCWFFNDKGSCPQAQASLGVLTSVLGTVFTAMIGLVGSVVGFYFGSEKKP